MSTIKTRLSKAVNIWKNAQYSHEKLLNGIEFVVAYCWLNSPTIKEQDCPQEIQEFIEASWNYLGELNYSNILSRRYICDQCFESYRLENLSICTDCYNCYCYRCYHSLCSCGGDIVG